MQTDGPAEQAGEPPEEAPDGAQSVEQQRGSAAPSVGPNDPDALLEQDVSGAESAPPETPRSADTIKLTRQAPSVVQATMPSRRALLYLAICVAFAAFLVLPMVLTGAATTPPAPCAEGAVIAQAALAPSSSGPPHLFAVVRPPALPNLALGAEPGCQALYRSDDQGITWTVSFSATAEAPLSVVPGRADTMYLLTQRLSFPLGVAGNLYQSTDLGAAWTWTRISPQGRHAIPVVAADGMLVGDDGSIVLHEVNGDGAALVRSTDGGASWQPLVIPGLPAAGSAAALGGLLATAPERYAYGTASGVISADGGAHWRPLAPLPDPPRRADSRPVLSADPVERAILLNLVPAVDVTADHPVARYASTDGGVSWQRVRCGARPAPGCAPITRWAAGAAARYVLYHRRIFRAAAGKAWQPLPVALPIRSDAVLQLLVNPSPSGDTLYVVTATAIWRLDGNKWQSASEGLALGGPTPVAE